MSTKLGNINAKEWLPGDMIIFVAEGVKGPNDLGLVISADHTSETVTVIWQNDGVSSNFNPQIMEETCCVLIHRLMTAYRNVQDDDQT